MLEKLSRNDDWLFNMKRIMNRTQISLSFAKKIKKQKIPLIQSRMPAEWERHEATWFTWPHNPETWNDLAEIESIYLEIISILVRGEKVKILIESEEEEEKIHAKFSKRKIKLEQVEFHKIKTCDSWIRDYGPNFVFKQTASGEMSLAANRWIFNGWGHKYEEHLEDEKASKQIAASLNIPITEPGIVLEGGSIDSNGAGVILTTEECLLNSNRNPNLSKKEIGFFLKRFLGAKKVIWLGKGIEGDDTDGHVDDIARFVNCSTILATVQTDRKDNDFAVLRENLRRLKEAKNLNGEKFLVVEFPTPKPIDIGGKRLPASYANFYIGNAAVLVPTFDDPNDKTAIRVIKKFFPGRDVIGIPSKPLVCGLGAIHCLTHEEPALPL